MRTAMRRTVQLAGLALASSIALAEPSDWYGTWVQRKPAPLTMTVKRVDAGTQVTYHLPPGAGSFKVMSLVTNYDGNDAPVLIDGKPSPETMSIKRVDDRHTITVIKVNGTETGTSRAELSTDGKVLRVDNHANVPSGPKSAITDTTEYWDKQ